MSNKASKPEVRVHLSGYNPSNDDMKKLFRAREGARREAIARGMEYNGKMWLKITHCWHCHKEFKKLDPVLIYFGQRTCKTCILGFKETFRDFYKGK